MNKEELEENLKIFNDELVKKDKSINEQEAIIQDLKTDRDIIKLKIQQTKTLLDEIIKENETDVVRLRKEQEAEQQ